jgi:tyrosine-protein kinase Etk/Wzc
MQENRTIQEKEESLITQLVFKFSPYWPLFLFVLVVFITIAFAYLRYATPKYEATATLIIKDQKKGYDDSKFLESLDFIGTKKIVENEVEVIQSRTLMEKVVRSLRLYAPLYEEGKIKATPVYSTAPVFIEAKDPDSLTEVKKIYIELDNKAPFAVLNHSTRYPLNQWVRTEFGDLKFVPNQKFINRGKPFYFSLVQPKKVVQKCLRKLEVTPSSKLSSILSLAYRDDAPDKAEDVLNELIINYDRAAIKEKNSLAQNTLAFVEERLSAVTKDLNSIERQIQQFKSNKGVVDISTQGRLFLENVSENDQKVSDVNMQLAVLSQVQNYILSKDRNGGIIPSTLGINDPVLTQLLDKLYTSQLEYERLKKTVAENNPILVSLTDQINNIRPNILENIKSHRRSLESSRGNLQNTNGSYSSLLRSIPSKERELLEISREQSIKNNIYSFLLQKKEESALSFAAAVSDSRIVDKAQASSTPVSPNKKIIYLASIVIAFFFSVSLIFLRETFNGKIMYRHEIENATHIPIVGELTFSKTGPIVIESGKRTFMAEEFRKLRIALPFLGIGANHKKVLITSSIPGEGKSFIAANLAISLALVGKKVILIDLDLNNPSLGKILQIDNEVGISNYLMGEMEPEEFIKRVHPHENLFFVPAGNLPQNPSELLSNGKVKNLLSYLENIFDLVIIDAAPVVPVTDAYILSAYCDATLYIVRHKYTPKIIVKRIDENNKINHLTNAAIIFNGVKARGLFNKSYGYGYGYGYVYGEDAFNKRKTTIA